MSNESGAPSRSPEWFELLLDGIDDAVTVLDRDWRMVYANRTAETLYLRPRDAMVGRNVWEVFPDAAGTEVEAGLRRAAESGAAQTFEYFYEPRGAWFRTRAVPAEGGAVVAYCRETTELRRFEERQRAEQAVLEAINRISTTMSAQLDLESLVQTVTDEATRMTGAQFGAFFYNVENEQGESYQLYTLSGVPREAFSKFPMPRNTAIFAPTFDGEGVVRIDDVLADPRYGKNPPYNGMPKGHLPVRGYLAVPVVSRSGEVLGGLFFGHSEPGVFTEHHERVLVGVASQAAIAIDNARLYREARAAGDRLSKQLRLTGAITASLGEGIFSLDREGVVTYVNPAAQELLGWSEAELIGRPMHDTIHYQHIDGSDFPLGDCPILGSIEGHRPARVEDDVFSCRDGNTLPVSYTSSPILADGQLEGVVVAFQDTRARKLAEAERERLLAAEQEARRHAEEASRAKDEFLAMVSHELRTPLNSMLGWMRLLRSGRLDEPTYRRGLDTIERNVSSQAQLIEDLLDISRIVTGKLRLDVQPVQLEPVVRAAIDSSRPAADAKAIRLTSVLDPSAGRVSGDPERLQQVVWNLLSNAIKFTPKGGAVQVRLARVDSHVEIVVSDTGQGVPPEFLPYVFERFRQADASITRKFGGLGLGLAIVRHLTELHGGSVTVNSAGVGQGAEFTVRLPLMALQRVPEGEPRPEPDASHFGAPFDCPPELAGARVLVVDDEADTREMLAVVLGQCDAVVATAGSVREALSLLESWKPDVLVSDIGMPGEDGHDLIRRVRQLPADAGGSIPAVALTAYARFEDRMKALGAGFQMHVAKPVEPSELVMVIHSLLGLIGKE